MNESPILGFFDPDLSARITRRTPLLYAAGADAAIDLPAHVRAASSLARINSYLIVIQDDANFIALIDLERMSDVRHLSLPAGEGGLRQFDDVRGNKNFKLDLEACCTISDRHDKELLVAFGSGTKPNRERILIVKNLLGELPEINIYEAAEFYQTLHQTTQFSGSELNVEGAIFAVGKITLFNRSNGAAQNNLLPVDATCEIDWQRLYQHLQNPQASTLPAPQKITQYEIGTLGGIRLGFTDAALVSEDSSQRLFSAAAEAAPDATRDGFVAGSVIGIFDRSNKLRWTPLCNWDGTRFWGKVEGLQTVPNEPNKIFAVIDVDDPAAPSELCEVKLDGNWFAA